MCLYALVCCAVLSSCGDEEPTDGSSGGAGTSSSLAPESLESTELILYKSSGEKFIGIIHQDSQIKLDTDVTVDYSEEHAPSYSYSASGNTADYSLTVTKKTYVPYYETYTYGVFTFELKLVFNNQNGGTYSGVQYNMGGSKKSISGTFTLRDLSSSDGQDSEEPSAIDYSLIEDGSSWVRELFMDESNGKVPRREYWTFGEKYDFTELTEMSDNTVIKTRSGEWDIDRDNNILTLYLFDENGNETGIEDYCFSTLNSEKMVIMRIIDSLVCEPMIFTSIETPPLPSDKPDDNRPQDIDISEPVVTDITMNSAVVKGTILGDNVTFRERGACYSTSPNPTVNDSKAETLTDFANISLENLFEGTVYYVRLYAIVNNKVYYGKEVSFETEGKRTYRIKLNCDIIGARSIRLQAKVPNEVGKYGLCYGTSPHPKVTDDYISERERETTWRIDNNLKPNTMYYIRAYHKEGTKITYFEDSEISVRTLGPDGVNVDLDYTCEDENSKTGYCSGVTYTITYSNLPKGTNEISFLIYDYGSYDTTEIITKYTETSSGTLTINPNKRYLKPDCIAGGMDLVIRIVNLETGVWYMKQWNYHYMNKPTYFEECVEEERYYNHSWVD